MKAFFSPQRYFFSNDGWYMAMRPGDEVHERHYIYRRLKYYPELKMTLAGPFRTKGALRKWFEGFISFYSKNRKASKPYIPDDLILLDRN